MGSNLIAKQLETAEHVLVGLFDKRIPSSQIFARPPGFGKSYLLRKSVRNTVSTGHQSGLPPNPYS
jgi:hypothetical protein